MEIPSISEEYFDESSIPSSASTVIHHSFEIDEEDNETKNKPSTSPPKNTHTVNKRTSSSGKKSNVSKYLGFLPELKLNHLLSIPKLWKLYFYYHQHEESDRSGEISIQNNHRDIILKELEDPKVRELFAKIERENIKFANENQKVHTSQFPYYFLGNFQEDTTKEHVVADMEFWETTLNDFDGIGMKMPLILKLKIKGGIPQRFRVKSWLLLSGINIEYCKETYDKLLRKMGKSSDDSGVEEETGSEVPFERIIHKDVSRTFPKVKMFQQQEIQEALVRLLKTYSLYDPEIGYCQGLSFVAGILLLQGMSEYEAFGLLSCLLGDDERQNYDNNIFKCSENNKLLARKTHNLFGLFTNDMQGLHELLAHHSQLVETHLPKLHKHFQNQGIYANMYASQWYLTVFSYEFPFHFVFRIMDIGLNEGMLDTMLRFSLSLLHFTESRILSHFELEDTLTEIKLAYQTLLLWNEHHINRFVEETFAKFPNLS